MSINMSHIAAAASPAGKNNNNNVKQMTTLYVTGRQPSLTQIPVPKKFTASLRVGLDNGGGGATSSPTSAATSPSPVRSMASSSVAARAQMFQNGSSSPSSNAISNNSFHTRNGSSGVNGYGGGGGGHSRTSSSGSSGGGFGSTPASGSSSPTKTFSNGFVLAKPPLSSAAAPPPSPASNGSAYSSSVAFSNGAPAASAASMASPAASAADKWRVKFEDAERKRKALITSSEKSAREATELQRKLQHLQREHEATKRELKDREDKLTQLRTVSERVYKEYDQLKNRYEVETGAMHQAMQRASEWYKQNRELKRRSTAIMQKYIQVQPDGALLDLLDDETDSAQAAKDEDELEDLRNTVKRLSGEVARLQSELNSARLQEFEAQEAAVTASAELDEARRTQAELAELRALRDNMAAAASLVHKEVAALRQQYEQERQAARRMKSEADKAVKERNVMAHQSSLLAEALSQDDHLLPLLAEVENLKRLLEEERCRVRDLDSGHSSGSSCSSQELELLDERLKIAEEELGHASGRAERAERESRELRERLSQMEKELEERKAAVPPPPPPPPMAPPIPPPPPPPPLPGGGVVTGALGGVKLRHRGASGGSGASSATGSSEDLVNAERNAVQDMANLLGIPRKPQVPEAIPGGAIDNIINQIKGGRFTLKSTEQNLQKEKKEEPPPAVTEMLSILGTLRRRPRASMMNQPTSTEAPRDVAL